MKVQVSLGMIRMDSWLRTLFPVDRSSLFSSQPWWPSSLPTVQWALATVATPLVLPHFWPCPPSGQPCTVGALAWAPDRLPPTRFRVLVSFALKKKFKVWVLKIVLSAKLGLYKTSFLGGKLGCLNCWWFHNNSLCWLSQTSGPSLQTNSRNKRKMVLEWNAFILKERWNNNKEALRNKYCFTKSIQKF